MERHGRMESGRLPAHFDDGRMPGAVPLPVRAAVVARLAPRIVHDGEGAPRSRLGVLRAILCCMAGSP
jgi:hypothetical protein